MSETKSLTTPPTNLKEAIDWLVRIAFLDKGGKLKDAVEALEDFTSVTKRIGDFNVQGPFNYVCKALKTLIGYNTVGGTTLTDNGIARKDTPCYTSSYGSSAQWDDDMNTLTSDKAKKVALIFLCYVPILYIGITYLFWQCSNTQSHVGWKSLQLRSTNDALYLFMSSMGFTPTQLNGNTPLSALVDSLLDCPSNLKEAIDWILRVTGKDGDGDNDTKQLADAVKELLTSAIGESPGPAPSAKDADMFKALSEWLDKNQNGEGIKKLIDALANGLAKFIGYTNTSNGLIGVGGISVSNDPLERLRDAVLGFLAGFLRQLNQKYYTGVLKLTSFSAKFSKAVTALNGGIGKGKGEFEKAITQTQSALTGVNASSITNVWSKLKNVNELKKDDLNGLSTAFQSYLQKVLGAVENDGSVKRQMTLFNAPVKEVVGIQHGPIDLGTGGLQKVLEDVKYNNAHSHPSQVQKLQPQAKALASAVYNATTAFRRELGRQTYVSSYAPSFNLQATLDKNKCAKIFLGSIPLYYYGMTYLYWQCRKNGAWSKWPFGRGNGYDLRYFMAAIGFDINQFNLNSGENVMKSVSSKLTELSSDTGTEMSYPMFLSKLHESLIKALKADSRPRRPYNGSVDLYHFDVLSA
ncbi:variant erythrocyte surface antigen-1 family protein [Babesia caballi]|uniref:Variant erythrocyte surface antigen-1 family protein n=1 Tax=Babesia caballi TaxID=5871 RepID=A0AAV4LRH6_BABCB|nr:variant erythrocyte surface antigen-1 family protein [Babesia caballi]